MDKLRWKLSNLWLGMVVVPHSVPFVNEFAHIKTIKKLLYTNIINTVLQPRIKLKLIYDFF